LTRLALQKGDINQAKTYAEKYKMYIEMHEPPQNIQFYYSLSGLIALAEGKYDKAISDLKLSDLVDDPFNNYYIALAYLKNNNKTKAIEQFENVVNKSGKVYLTYVIIRSRAEKQLACLKTSE
jgi:tetratricopeptide (TPR) repeat protein